MPMISAWNAGRQAFAFAACLIFAASCGNADPAIRKPISETDAQETAPSASDIMTRISATLETAAATKGPGAPALWTLKDEDTTIYLFGTFHLLKPGFKWRTDRVDAAFEASDHVVFEADLISPEAQAVAAPAMLQAGLFTDGTQLTDLLDDAQDAALAEGAAIAGLPLPALNGLKPWMASVFLGQSIITQAGFDPAAGVESVLEREARTENKTFGYLETLEAQIDALSAGSPTDQINSLMVSLATLEFGPDMINALADEWADGDTKGLTVMAASPDALGSQAAYQALLVQRNQNWLPQIIAMLETPRTVFVAVGAAHLVGDDSVIALLRADGYEVDGP